MPNILDANGLQVKTRAELLSEFNSDFQNIYGADINLGSDTPDGQLIGIFIQAILDYSDLLTQVYNSMDPDNALGVVLDQRVALNGIQRQAGTFTITNITVTVDRAVTLYGQDQDVEDVFTVQDDAGNQFQLASTYSFASSGSQALVFTAANPGEVLTVPNTITTPVTIVLGVTSVNNPTTYTTLGVNEESDADLKIRRQRSVALASQGFLEGLIAALENVSGVNFVAVYENRTGSEDADGIPSHSIWVIVSGGADEDIANAIYQKRNAGCGMKGDQTYTITQIDGSPFVVRWDDVVSEDLYIDFDVEPLDGVTPVNTSLIIEELPEIFTPGVYEQVNTNELATLVQQIDPNALVSNAGFSTASEGPYTDTLTPTAKNNIFSITSDNISINEGPYS